RRPPHRLQRYSHGVERLWRVVAAGMARQDHLERLHRLPRPAGAERGLGRREIVGLLEAAPVEIPLGGLKELERPRGVAAPELREAEPDQPLASERIALHAGGEDAEEVL